MPPTRRPILFRAQHPIGRRGGPFKAHQHPVADSPQNIEGFVASGATIVTQPWLPGPNELVMVSVAMRATGITPTVAGNGLNFVVVSDVTNAQGQSRLVVFRAMGANPTYGPITVTATANTNPVGVIASRYPSVDTSGTDGSGAVEAFVSNAGPPAVDDADMLQAITTLTANATAWAAGTYRSGLFTVPADEIGINVNLITGGVGGAEANSSQWISPPIITPAAFTMGEVGDLSTVRDWAMVVVSIKPFSLSDPQTVIPATATLIIAAFAPQVNLGIIPDTGTLALATFAPVIALGIIPAPAALTLTTFAPTVAVSANQTVVPGTASLTTQGLAPVIGLGIVPPTGALTLSAFAPVVTATDHQLVVPGVAALTLTSFAPVVTATDAQVVVPGTASLTLASFAPVVSVAANITVVPDPAALTLTSFAPVVTASNNVVVTPDTAALSLTGFAPDITAGSSATVVPGTLALVLQGYEPLVLVGGGGGVHTYPIPGPYIPKHHRVPGLRDLVELVPVVVTPETTRLHLEGYPPSVSVNDDDLVLELI